MGENADPHRVNRAVPPSKSRVVFLFLLALQFTTAFVFSAAIPATIHSSLFELSARYLALLAGLLLLALTSALLAVYIWKKGVPAFLSRQGWLDGLFASGVILAFGCAFLLGILHALSNQPENYIYSAYFVRLSPLLLVAAISSAELVFFITWQRRQLLTGISSWLHSFRTPWLITTLIGVVLFAFVFITRIGLTPETIGSWGKPAVPLLEWQILLVWVGSLAFLMLSKTLLKRVGSRIDLLMVVLVWAVCVTIWLSQPVMPGYFATAPRAPGFAIYPFSDGLTYANNAQAILAGVTWHGEIPARPLYVTLLAGMHALVGQDYTSVIAVQTLLLAFFPALLYLIGKEMGSRPLGLAAAGLTILRDVTANQFADFALNLTYSKLFFSELPTALLLSLAVYLTMRWLNRGQTSLALPLAAGGAIGLAMLIRTQSLIVLPIVLFIGLLHAPGKWRQWLIGAALALLGTALAVAPWLVHNARLTGGLVFDHPASQTLVIAQRYNGMNFNDPIPRMPEENLSEYSSRLMRMAVQGFAANPDTSMRMAGGNWLNNWVDNLLILPLRTSLDSPGELFKPDRAFWQDWNGSPSGSQSVVLVLYLLIFTTGVAAAWQLQRWVGLMPLAVNLGYNFWTGFFLSSGERFLVPVDWGFYLYLFLGLLTLGILLLHQVPRLNSLLQMQPLKPVTITQVSVKHTRKLPGITRLLVLSLTIFLAGASVPWSETAVPNRYLTISNPQTKVILETAVSRLSSEQAEEIARLISNPQTVIEYGRVVYPRYYAAGEGEPDTAKTGYAPSAEARLVFHFLGSDNHLVVFYLNQPPAYFPHTADVFLLYEQDADKLSPEAVLVVESEQVKFYQADLVLPD